MRTYLALFVTLVVAVIVAPISMAAEPDFVSYWHDGKAELSGYTLTVSRYGQERVGSCTMIYVTEPFSRSRLVKVDDPKKNPDDTFNVLKLNIVRDFQTGIYDYNTMVSLFVNTQDFSPAKLSFSSAEWCGHVYNELLFRPEKIEGLYHSYFEDESGRLNLAKVEGGIVEDNLFVLLRGLRGAFLEPGEKKEYEFLPSVYFARLAHQPSAWTTVEISRRDEPQSIDVPAGSFETIVYNIKTKDGREGTFYVENAHPYRIVRWNMLPDIKGELKGSERLAYWRLNRNGNEDHLKALGLQ